MELLPKTSEEFNLEQIQILKIVAGGANLAEVLEKIVQLIEKNSPGLCSIILIDQETKRIKYEAAPHLPKPFIEAIENCKIGPMEGSCGAAAYLGERVFIPDIATHPNWDKYRQYALPFGLRSCWSSPIFSPTKQVLGTFAVYYKEVRNPEGYELAQVESATSLASVAIMKEQADLTLKRSEARYRQILETANEGIITLDLNTCVTFANRRALDLLGYKSKDLLGKSAFVFIDNSAQTQVQGMFERRRKGVSEQNEVLLKTKNGQDLWTIISSSPIRNDKGEISGMLGMITDITLRKQTEEMIAATLRIESLGTLAGGIAHDFNNLLTTIVGNITLAQRSLDEQDKAQKYLVTAKIACTRAADLTSRILSFGKSVRKSKQSLDLQAVTEETLQLLKSNLPKNIELDVRYEADLPSINADPSQIHQIIMNLCTNAIRAMGPQGKLKIALSRVSLYRPFVTQTRELPPGCYILLSVSDTGSGMTPNTLKRIFDPFFTTSPPGLGSGLGLFVVHKIVRESHGGIAITSKIGEGSRFDIYFPCEQKEKEIGYQI